MPDVAIAARKGMRLQNGFKKPVDAFKWLKSLSHEKWQSTSAEAHFAEEATENPIEIKPLWFFLPSEAAKA
jgi:hypothetical protein